MAITINRYNHTLKKLLNKEVNYTTLKFMLLNDSASFNPANSTLAAVAGAGNANQVSGNGWATGGEPLAGVSVSTVSGDAAMIDAADISKLATGGPIGPAYKAVIYDDSGAGDAPLWFIDFDSAQTAGVGTEFKVTFDVNGIQSVASPE